MNGDWFDGRANLDSSRFSARRSRGAGAGRRDL